MAVYLATSPELANMEDIPLEITDDGMTIVDEIGRPVHCAMIHCAMSWNDISAFQDLLVQRLVR